MKKQGLSELYKDHFDIGAAINPRLIAHAGDLIRAEFSSVTCENEMKFESVHPAPGEYTFERADIVADFAVKNNLKMRGHTLVWHHQTGAWLFQNEDGSQADKATVLGRMREHIHTVVKRYAGAAHCWDVVNEAVSDAGDGNLRVQSPFYSVFQSAGFIEEAFRYAHEADPAALLFYNDYNTENPAKRDGIVKLVQSLLDKNIPVHGVGIQAHWGLDLDLAEVQKTIDTFASLGLGVHITELDVSIYKWGAEDGLDFATPPADRMERQAQLYKDIFRVLRANKGKVGNVTFWGVCDSHSWLNYFPVKRNNYPLLFDANLRPKDAYRAITDF